MEYYNELKDNTTGNLRLSRPRVSKLDSMHSKVRSPSSSFLPRSSSLSLPHHLPPVP